MIASRLIGTPRVALDPSDGLGLGESVLRSRAAPANNPQVEDEGHMPSSRLSALADAFIGDVP